jgi:hypothetical protein
MPTAWQHRFHNSPAATISSNYARQLQALVHGMMVLALIQPTRAELRGGALAECAFTLGNVARVLTNKVTSVCMTRAWSAPEDLCAYIKDTSDASMAVCGDDRRVQCGSSMAAWARYVH